MKIHVESMSKEWFRGKSLGTMAADWPTLLAQSFLLQAWIPTVTEKALQMHCWHLGA